MINCEEENSNLCKKKNFNELFKILLNRNRIGILNNIIIISHNLMCDSQEFICDLFNNEVFSLFLDKIVYLINNPINKKVYGINKEKEIFFIDSDVINNFINLCELIIRNESFPDVNKLERMMEIICDILVSNNDNMSEKESLWILFYFSNYFSKMKTLNIKNQNFDFIFQTFIRKNIFNKLISIDYRKNVYILEIILNFFLNITLDNSGIVYHLLEINLLDFLKVVLGNNENNINYLNIVLGILLNISDSQDSNKQEIISSELLSFIFTFILNRANVKLQIKIVVVKLIHKLSSNCKFGIASALIKIKIFEVIINIFENRYLDPNIIFLILESLRNIFLSAIPLKDLSTNGNIFVKKFEFLGGLTCLEKLLNSPNKDVYELVNQIYSKNEY